jgi:hypothetical protein
MTGCVESGNSVLFRELDATIEELAPAVEDLLQRAGPAEQIRSDAGEGGIKYAMPVHFPDGIGQGQLVARLFRYREAVRLDVELEHNRVFTRPDGGASDRRCFFNDFVASITLPAGTRELSVDFRRRVLSGLHAAREAVQRYNRKHPEPWNAVKVVASRPALTSTE